MPQATKHDVYLHPRTGQVQEFGDASRKEAERIAAERRNGPQPPMTMGDLVPLENELNMLKARESECKFTISNLDPQIASAERELAERRKEHRKLQAAIATGAIRGPRTPEMNKRTGVVEYDEEHDFIRMWRKIERLEEQLSEYQRRRDTAQRLLDNTARIMTEWFKVNGERYKTLRELFAGVDRDRPNNDCAGGGYNVLGGYNRK
jgi:hypothetical protein